MNINVVLIPDEIRLMLPISKTVRSPGNTMTNVLSVYRLSGSFEPFSSATNVPEKINFNDNF